MGELPLLPGIRVLDDFFQDPDWVSGYLRDFKGRSHETSNYPHLVFPSPLSEVKESVETLANRLDPIFRTSPFDVTLRVSLEEHAGKHRTFVHIDASLNVIIYLEGREGPENGTVFYRHRDLGLTTVKENTAEAAKFGLLLNHDTNDFSRWEEISRIPFRRNRAVIFSGRYFHSPPEEYYGKSVMEGRVTMNFFFPELNGLFI